MIIGIEIGLTLLGLYALIKRKWPMGKKGYLIGKEAIILGILSVITFPVVFIFCIVVVAIVGLIKGPAFILSSQWVGIGIEAGIVILWTALLFILNARFGRTGRIIAKDQAP